MKMDQRYHLIATPGFVQRVIPEADPQRLGHPASPRQPASPQVSPGIAYDRGHASSDDSSPRPTGLSD